MSISVCRLIAACAVLLFLLPLARAQQPSPLPDSLAPVIEVIEKNYWRDISRDSLIEIVRSGDLSRLDPYSDLLDSLEWDDMNLNLAGSFGGIGASLNFDSTVYKYQIAGTFLGSPALRAGLRDGDILAAVDGALTDSLTFDQLLSRMRGEIGTTVRVSVLRDGKPDQITVEIVREKIIVTSIRGSGRSFDGPSRYHLESDSTIGYLRINSFSSTTVQEVDSALEIINRSGAQALILDLRDNFGGLMRAARGVADLFLDSGKIVSLHGRSEPDTTYRAASGVKFSGPVAMLINRETVSSGEILAAALQDNGRVSTVGERSFGKGMVQELYPLADSLRGIKLTVAQYIRPSGKPMERHLPQSDTTIGGVYPDSGMTVVMSAEQRVTQENIRFEGDRVWQFAGQPMPLASALTDPEIALACEVLRKKISR